MSQQKSQDLLDQLQKDTFKYFLNETNLRNGLIVDKNRENWPASIAATGLGLASLVVGVKRGFILRKMAAERTLAALRFFWNSEQGPGPDTSGYKGFYYHFLDMKTGKRVWNCELSTIDTAFLMAGILTARLFFDKANEAEAEIRHLANQLYQRVDWQWAQNGASTITHGWTPENQFLPYRWEKYDEAMLLYLLALGSPTFPVGKDAYKEWCKNYKWEKHYGYEYLYSGSFFTHQLSHIWVDFRGIQDEYMRTVNIDYFENSRRATYVQQQYAIANPLNFVGYSDCCWGITASDGPGYWSGMVNGVERVFFDYIARAVPYGPDDGTIAPWSTITSIPFAPEIVFPALDYYINNLKIAHTCKYGFTSTFNQTYPEKNHPSGWVSSYHYGINQGPVLLMIENYRSQFIWNLMRECPYLRQGLHQAGFTGGWLG